MSADDLKRLPGRSRGEEAHVGRRGPAQRHARRRGDLRAGAEDAAGARRRAEARRRDADRHLDQPVQRDAALREELPAARRALHRGRRRSSTARACGSAWNTSARRACIAGRGTPSSTRWPRPRSCSPRSRSKNVGFVLDSWHWFTAGEGEAELLSVTARDVVAVDLNDAQKGVPLEYLVDNQRELPATTGVIDAGLFLSALARIGYDGPVRAEPFNAALNALDDDAACAATARRCGGPSRGCGHERPVQHRQGVPRVRRARTAYGTSYWLDRVGRRPAPATRLGGDLETRRRRRRRRPDRLPDGVPVRARRRRRWSLLEAARIGDRAALDAGWLLETPGVDFAGAAGDARPEGRAPRLRGVAQGRARRRRLPAPARPEAGARAARGPGHRRDAGRRRRARAGTGRPRPPPGSTPRGCRRAAPPTESGADLVRGALKTRSEG